MPLKLDGTYGVSGIDGTASTPALRGSDLTGNGIVYGTDTVQIATGGTAAVTVDSSQNVGIGTVSPAGKTTISYSTNGVYNTGLSVTNTNSSSSAGASFQLSNDAGNRAGFYLTSSTCPFYGGANTANLGTVDAIPLTFITGNSERARIDSSGNVGIGTTSPSSYGQFVVYNATTGAIYAAGGSVTTYMYGSNGGSIGAFGTQSNHPLTLNTNNTERMRIDTSGNVGIGTNAPATLLHINGTIRYTNRPAAGTITAIGFDANGDLKASSSSLRYKENVQDYTKGLSEVLNIRPVTFTFIGEDKLNAGFIVEEIDQKGLDEFVLRNEDGLPDAIPYGNMVALLTKAIQELSAKLDAAEARIAALEAK